MTLHHPHPASRSGTRTSIMMQSRRYFDLLDPRPEDVDLGDIARGLDVPRFLNQTTQPVTIADHHLRCGRIALALGLPLEVVLAVMVHDAGEAYLGDPPGPVKSMMRFEAEPGVLVGFDEIEHRILNAIIEAIIPVLMYDEGLALGETLRGRVAELCSEKRGVVKQIDELALRGEAMLWLPGSEDWVGASAGAVDGRAVSWGELMPVLVAPQSVFGPPPSSSRNDEHAKGMWWGCMSAVRRHTEPLKIMQVLRGWLLVEAT